MQICPHCGEENLDRARFCLSCAHRLREASPGHEQRRLVTIVFCDVVGSTALGEQSDPEAFRSLLAGYFDRMKRGQPPRRTQGKRHRSISFGFWDRES
jgi:hypothetical protein